MTRIAFAAFLTAAWVPALHAQTTWYVDAFGTPPGTGTISDPYTSLQFAIDQPTTLDGDTVLVAAGVYFEHVDLGGKSLEIAGEGAGQTFLDGSDSGRVMRYSAGASGVLRDLTVRHGRAMGSGEKGGGVWIEGGSPELRRVIVTQCAARIGGGIAVDGGSPWIVECTITFNGVPIPSTESGAGIHASASSSPLIELSEITFNRYTDFGGGIAGAGTYRQCQIENNMAARGGGAHAMGAALTLEECSVSHNTAGTTLGDLLEGGGVIGPATLVGCSLENNLANFEGGGALECTLIDCEIRGNVLDNFNTSTVVTMGAGAARSSLTGCVIEDNLVGGDVSGIEVLRGDGAGVSDCTVFDSILRGNLARNGRGGGAFRSTLTGCTIVANEARIGAVAGTGVGGAAAESSLVRCDVYDNVAERGAGVWNSSLEHCTVASNVAAASGGAVFDELGAATIVHSILWNNEPDQIDDATMSLAVSYSVVSGGFSGASVSSADPAFFGPMSRDHRLKPGSPCIDAGDPLAPLDPDGSVTDLGAYTFDPLYCSTPTAWCAGKLNSQNCVPTAEATGSTSLSGPDDLVLFSANQVDHKSGFLFWGPTPWNAPFGGGTRCVGPGATRTPFQSSNGDDPPSVCTGVFSFPFTHAYAAGQALSAGQTLYGQWYSRDPQHPDGTGIGLSQALEWTVCP